VGVRTTPEGGPSIDDHREQIFLQHEGTGTRRAYTPQAPNRETYQHRTEIVETEKGYEFQFNPSVVSIADLADWVVAESKCCPFFDFHIDLEREGTLVCLRLTGDQGIKRFIHSQFQLPAK
jgi:hypothetical protein